MRVLVVSAGRGPAEVRRFVAELGPALGDLLVGRGLDVADVDLEPASARILFEGEGVVTDLVGTHELVDTVRGRGARRRWFAGVSLHEPATSVGAFRERDVVVTATRSGGPGGQHVNTTASAVRATHRPTGLSVRVSGERSQHANRRVALKRLRLRLEARDQRRTARAEQRVWRSHDAVTRGQAVATWRRRRGGQLECVRTGGT